VQFGHPKYEVATPLLTVEYVQQPKANAGGALPANWKLAPPLRGFQQRFRAILVLSHASEGALVA
jgi:hypothetical protein